ncbi:hypothetical protein, partial [Sphaerospermopsis sp. LEGE 08334]|uniref:hypothetical protein n=1 Tax=Sphaerospermopsis sp. LEGE 08334 TaxID=1828651 RepID=UPI001D151C1A
GGVYFICLGKAIVNSSRFNKKLFQTIPDLIRPEYPTFPTVTQQKMVVTLDKSSKYYSSQ